MISFRKLQNRLFIAFAGLSFIICLFFIRFSGLLISTAENNVMRAILMHEQAELLRRLEDGKPAEIRADYFELSITAHLPVQFRQQLGDQDQGMLTTGDNHQYLFTRFTYKETPYALMMKSNAFAANTSLSQYKSLFLYSISSSVIILCVLSSWYLAKWLARPIASLTADVERQRVQTLNAGHSGVTKHQAFYGLTRQDEIGELAKALELSYSQVQTLLARERNFTRDVSHELRTPITLIKNTLTLYQGDQLEHTAMKILNDATRELEQTVEVLLALARQENLKFTRLELLPVIEKTVLNILFAHPNSGFDVKLEVEPNITALGNHYLMKLLFQNLVNNGFYHGGQQVMTITGHGNQLSFKNPIRSVKGDNTYNGLGHGQYLIKRIVEEMGWSMTIKPTPTDYQVIINFK